MTGTLYGLGVGPGDPDLMTLKAHKILQSAPVIAYPAPDVGDSMARAIAAPHLPDGREEIAIRTPMVPGKYPAHDVYDAYADRIAGHLEAGRDVAVLCEGDPFFFGSFMYLYDRLAERFPAVVVPGVSSLGASAACAGMPLVSRLDVLTVIPGPLDDEALARHLAATEAVVIMKVGRHLGRIRDLLERLGLLDGAVYVEHATLPNERVQPLSEVTDEKAPYFSMILAGRGRREPPKPGVSS